MTLTQNDNAREMSVGSLYYRGWVLPEEEEGGGGQSTPLRYQHSLCQPKAHEIMDHEIMDHEIMDHEIMDHEIIDHEIMDHEIME